MNFRLEKKSTGPALTKFFVRDSTNAIVGTIAVANEQANDLAKHWHPPAQAVPAAKAAADRAAAAKARIVTALLRKGPRLTRQAVLRGS